MEVLDVKKITDIPGIEDYLDKTFSLSCYDRGDNTQIYTYEIDTLNSIVVEIISDEKLLTCKEFLADLINQDNVGYLSFSTYKGPEYGQTITSGYHFRPGVEEFEKNYYKG